MAIPQVRECDFYPSSLDIWFPWKGIRSERALKLALAEICFQGVSTRFVLWLSLRKEGSCYYRTDVWLQCILKPGK